MRLRSRILLPLTITLAVWPGLSAEAEERLVTLLYTNDIESVYEPVEAFWNPDIELIGGIPYLATLIDQVRAQEELSFLFDAGDIYTGALSQATEGRLPFDLYSLMGYDAVNLGNHEFEYGWQSLHRIRQRARFPVLSANLVYENTNIDFCRPTPSWRRTASASASSACWVWTPSSTPSTRRIARASKCG